MIIHLTGADTYRSAQRLAELRRAFIAKHDPQGFNTITLDASATKLTDLRNAVNTTGFFSRKRFVALDRYEAAGSGITIADLHQLGQPLLKNNDIIFVIRDFHSGAARSRKKTSARKTGGSRSTVIVGWPSEKLEKFPAMSDAETETWLMKQAKLHQGSLTQSAATRLVAVIGIDSWRLAAELEKLIAYAGGRPIEAADIDQMVTGEYSHDIFALTDSLGQRQTARALDLISRALLSGTSPLALVATLARHVTNLWAVKAAEQRGLPPAAIAGELNLHPYVVQKSLAQSQRFTAEELRQLHHQLLLIDHELKSTSLDAEALLDLLIVKPSLEK